MTKFSKQRTKPELEKHLANHIIQQATVSMEDLVTTNAPKPITKLSINKHKNPCKQLKMFCSHPISNQ
jgi:hypothetical protein